MRPEVSSGSGEPGMVYSIHLVKVQRILLSVEGAWQYEDDVGPSKRFE